MTSLRPTTIITSHSAVNKQHSSLSLPCCQLVTVSLNKLLTTRHVRTSTCTWPHDGRQTRISHSVTLFSGEFVTCHRTRLLFSPLKAVAAPAQQRSQVISRSEHPRARSPGCTFLLRKVDDLFSRRPQNTKAANAAEIVSLTK